MTQKIYKPNLKTIMQATPDFSGMAYEEGFENKDMPRFAT